MQLRHCLIIMVMLLLSATVSPASEPITVVAVGDLLLGGSAAPTVKKRGYRFPFRALDGYLSGADIVMANLEAPLTREKEAVKDKKFTFKVHPKAANQLKLAGFDLFTLANNHLGDYGHQGVLDTLEHLDRAGIAHTGAGRDLKQARTPAIIERNGSTIAFLAYSNTYPKSFYAKKNRPGTAPGYYDFVKHDVQKAARQADYVIVSFHWGAERMYEPKHYQRELAHLSINSGADVVIGHHPHVLQGVEFYGDGVIYYSLGNFAFGSYSRKSHIGGLARVVLQDGKVDSAEILPLNVYNPDVHFQPQPMSQGPAYAFAVDFAGYCADLQTRLTRQPDLFWGLQKIEPPAPPQVADINVETKKEKQN